MSPNRQRKENYNENWEAEIAKYDEACAADEKEFREHSLICGGNTTDLTEEETAVWELVLQGIPPSEIAGQFGVEEDMIAGLVTIIRAKLSISD